jgi:diguanylate cyclase (GGDEF)-like protein
MGITQTSRPARLAGRVLFAAAVLWAAAGAAVPETPDALLQRADELKTANNDEFRKLLEQLGARSDQLTPAQSDFLEYLRDWQMGYLGDYPRALSAFDALLSRTQDPTIRARARISLVSDQVNAAHYEDAYANISLLLDTLPQVEDRSAHRLSLVVAASAYNLAGQFELAQSFANQAIAYDNSDRSVCFATNQLAESLYKTRRLKLDDAQIRNGLEACQRIGDPLYANLIRLKLAQSKLDQGDPGSALASLEPYASQMEQTHSSEANALFRATLARGYLLSGDLAHAEQSARNAIEYANKQVNSEGAVEAWQVLYEIAKRQGNDKDALTFHEKYAAADRGYLDDTKARALAYQMVHQQVLDKKRQIDALNEKNQMLQLSQQLDSATARNRLLYIALLIAVLAGLAAFAYRTKRAQLKFQRLAQRDSLTGIFNRQHFMETAQDSLRYCAKDSREASVLALDLDHFKSINDMHGHAAGDAVLKRVVAACQSKQRSIDVFGRFGGEEFAILLPDCDETEAEQCAEEIRAAIAASRGVADPMSTGIVATASFGVASTQTCGYNLATLLANADSALYDAKRAGRNRVVTYRAPVAHAVNS